MSAPTHLDNLDALIRSAMRPNNPQQAMRAKLQWLAKRAQEAADAVDERGDVWHTLEGRACVNAMYDATEVDALYSWFSDLDREFGRPN